MLTQEQRPFDSSHRAGNDSRNLPVADSIILLEENTEISNLNSLSPSERLMRAKSLDRKTREVRNLFICPQHPFVQSDSVGTCTRCGFVLVKQGDQTAIQPTDSLNFLRKKKQKK